MKAEKKTKFVQFYPDMVKQCERIIELSNDMSAIEVDSDIVRVEIPTFSYEIIETAELEKLK